MPDSINTLAQLIQLAVAPVFLLTGIAGLLSVMTQRLGRVIDRSRVLNAAREGAAATADTVLLEEVRTLHTRMHLISRAITLCTYSALLVATVIAAIFLGALFGYHLAPAVAVGFVVAMLLLIAGLVGFLGEVHLATRSIRQRTEMY